MRPFAWLRNLGRVDWDTPPREAPVPPQDPAAVADAIAAVDIRLRELTGIPTLLRTAEHWDEMDRLLDRRMRLLRRRVPVIPGGTS